IKDVVFVIDSAKIRLASYNPNSRVSSLNSVFASRSNLKQRMGRAGRVQPGEYYLLITKTKHDSLPYNLPPELLRTDLQSTVLKIASLKSLDTLVHIESMRSQSAPPGARGLDEWRPSLRREGPPIPSVCDDVSTFLAQAPTPPSTGSIGEAIDSLRALGAIGTAEVIVADNPSASAEVGSSRRRLGYQPMRRRVREAVTPLGRVLADFSVDPWVGRMVLTGVAMRCLDPVLTVASLLGGSEGGGGGGPAGVFTMRPDERSVARRVLAAAFARDGAASDVLVSARAFDAWKRVASADGMSAAR
ncbi:ATP-dependent RNA helicase A, partial [Cladochytrium tenue]